MSGIGGFARLAPDATAIAALGRQISFQELDRRHRLLAGALAAAGVRRGHRIAVLSANRPELLEVTTGALRAGIVPVPINALLAPPEVAYILEDSGARWLFADRAVEAPPSVDRVVTFGDAYERVLYESDERKIADFTLGRPMHYTSGTTARPKGVWVKPHSRKRAAHISEQFRRLWGLDPDEVHLICSPLAHSAPHRFALRTIEAGGTVFVQERFSAEETLAAIDLFSATSTFMVPTHLERILGLRERIRATRDVSSIRLLAHAGAPIRPRTKRDVIAYFPHGSVWEFYGSTEGQATRISTEEWLRKPGSVGRANPGGDIIIRGDSGARLGPGEVGEVWIRDPDAERFSYWRDPKKTRAA